MYTNFFIFNFNLKRKLATKQDQFNFQYLQKCVLVLPGSAKICSLAQTYTLKLLNAIYKNMSSK